MIEEWRDIKGYEGIYQVSSYGRVRSFKRPGQPLKVRYLHMCYNVHGYRRVALTKNGVTRETGVHRLVATAFIPNPNNYPIVNHKDEVRDNNHVDNLEWCDYSYNELYNNCAMKKT